MKKYLYIALAALGMMGCEEELYPDGDGVGTLVISDIEVETVVGDIQTKASMVEESDIPEASEFTIVAINTVTQEETTLEIGINELEAGSYIVRATYGEEKGMSYTPYFSGEKEVTLTNGDTRPVSLSPSLQNAILHPKLDETLINQYNNYTLNIQKDDDESIPLTNDKDFYLPVGTEGTYTLTLFGENKLGTMVSHDWTYQGSQFVAKTRYIVNCNPDLPSFTLPAQAETNVWSKFIYITPMTAKSISYKPEGLADDDILSNVVYEASADGQVWTKATKKDDRWVIEGLNPNTPYSLRANFLEVYSTNSVSVTTESGAGVPNGDFEELTETINISGMNQGGRWRPTRVGGYMQNTCSFQIKEPNNWASVNKKTCNNEGALNKNSWFIIPSTYNTSLSWTGTVPDYGIWGGGGTETPEVYQNLSAQAGSNAMVIRNVAWDENGTSPSDDSKTTTSDGYYNRNVPVIANYSAGKLFLGSYSYSSGTETYDEGIEFVSRPVSLKGYYKYVQDGNDTDETGMVTVSLLNGETIIGTGSIAFNAVGDYTEFDVPITYSEASLKATELRIMITSSNHASYNQADETASIKTTNYNGRYESASRGAMLTVDNLTFSYDYPNNE